MDILKIYEEASGQEINMSKSEVFFSRNLSMAAQEDLSNIMGVKHVLGTSNYLGLPSMVGRSKKSTFAYVKDRIWKRINSWRGRTLSKAGKEVVIKSVLQSIPSYVMSVYLIPEATIKEIERMFNSFWWGGGSNNGGIKWLAWDQMTFPREYGGLGFRNLHLFNMAMVAKQGWNFIKKPNSLVAKVYKARYFPNSSFIASHLGNNPSYAWRSIWKSRQVLMRGCRWSIGDGTKIHVMHEPWLLKEDGKWIHSPQAQSVSNLYVNQLWLPNRKAWDSNKIQLMFPSHVANSILTIPLFDDVEEDQLVWDDDKFGNYSVKSGCNLLLQEPLENLTLQANEGWKWLWKIQAPPKTKHLLWRLCKGCLPTRVRLKEKQVNCPLNCPLCESEEEDDWHVIYGCEYSKRAWQAAGVEHLILPFLQQGVSTKDCLLKLCRNRDVDEAGKAATLLWLLWQNRNNWIWNNEKELGQQLGIKAMQMWHDWKAVQRVYSAGNRQEQQHIRSWQAPPQGIFKCNVDAGLHVVSRRTSAGWCVRDFRGYYVLGGSSWIHGICSSNVSEALASLGAMQELQQRGFETDAHNIVHAIRHRYNGESEFSSIINKIKCMLSSNLGFEVKPIRRQANMIAHSLARAAFSWPCRRFSDFIPSCINSLLVNEMI
jgi:hypothetical protein